MFEYFFLIIWHVGKPKKPKKGTLKILPENLNPPPGSPLCKEDVGNKEPHARRGRQLSWTQQIYGLFVVMPGMQPRGQGGPRTPYRVRGLQRPQRRRRPWKRGGTGQVLQQRDGEKRVE